MLSGILPLVSALIAALPIIIVVVVSSIFLLKRGVKYAGIFVCGLLLSLEPLPQSLALYLSSSKR